MPPKRSRKTGDAGRSNKKTKTSKLSKHRDEGEVRAQTHDYTEIEGNEVPAVILMDEIIASTDESHTNRVKRKSSEANFDGATTDKNPDAPAKKSPKLDDSKFDDTKLDSVKLDDAKSRDSNPDGSRLNGATPEVPKSGDSNPVDLAPDDTTPEDSNHDEPKFDDTRADNSKLDDPASDNPKLDKSNSDDSKLDSPKPVDPNPADPKPDGSKTGVREYGELANNEAEQDDLMEADRYWNRDPLSPLRDDDKQIWPGFREIETDADEFESMLRILGAKGLSVQYVLGLDPDILSLIPQTIVGFVFCFRHRSDDEGNQVDSCPDDIWFANQTHDWLCGSNALINILFNIPNLDLGEHLNAFKEFTNDFTPAQRGEAVGNYDFLRQVHNSCLRKMEILLGDVSLMEKYNNRRKTAKKAAAPEEKPPAKGKGKGKGKGKAQPKKKTVTEADAIDDDAGGYHYAAYLPIHGNIWKLDGLDRQPSKLEECNDDTWLPVAASILSERMMEVEDENSCSILAICREEDKLTTMAQQLAGTVQKLNMVLDALASSPETSAEDRGRSKTAIRRPDADLGLTQRDIDEAAELEVPEEVTDALSSGDWGRLRALRDGIVADQQGLKQDIQAEQKSRSQEAERLRLARHDHEPLVRTWLEMLANKEGVLRGMVESMQ